MASGHGSPRLLCVSAPAYGTSGRSQDRRPIIGTPKHWVIEGITSRNRARLHRVPLLIQELRGAFWNRLASTAAAIRSGPTKKQSAVGEPSRLLQVDGS